MKYALKYFSTSKKIAEADEIIISYAEPAPLDHLIWFATEKCRPEQRLVIEIDITALICEKEETDKNFTTEDYDDFFAEEAEKFANTMEKHPLLAVKITPTFGKMVRAFVECLKEYEVPFFYQGYLTDMGEVTALLNQGVSDIYVSEFLAFHMPEIKKLAKDINIRVYPNVAQAPAIYEAFTSKNYNIKKFFIRPEDIEQYEDYIDIIEFYGPLDKQDILMDIYKDGYWMGGLDELIIGFDDKINCMNLMPDFGFYRLACGHRCDTGKCNYCDISKSLAAELKAKNIYIKKERKDRTNEYNANEESSFNDGAEAI